MLRKSFPTSLVLIAAAVTSAQTGSVDPVARVGEREVTRAMLDAAVNARLNTGFVHGTPSPDRRRELEREQLQVLIRRELNLQGAFDLGLSLPLDSAEERRLAVERRLGKEAYDRSLEEEGMTPKDHRLMIAETLLANRALRENVEEKAKVTENEVRTAYETELERWTDPEAVRIEHILLKINPSASTDAVERAEVEANEIVADLNDGANFAFLAQQHSDDMYRVKGGDLGWVHRGRLVPELEVEVWQSAPGDLVGPVRSDQGFHIARVLERRPARQMAFDEAAPMVRQLLEQEKLAETEEDWFNGLKETYDVVVFDPDLIEGSN